MKTFFKAWERWKRNIWKWNAVESLFDLIMHANPWPLFDYTKPIPAQVTSALTLIQSKARQLFAIFQPPSRDCGTQLAIVTNWIQSSSLRAKKWAIQPRTDGILCSVLSLPLPSLRRLSLCYSYVKQTEALVEKAMRHSTYWRFSWDRSSPRDGAGGIFLAPSEKGCSWWSHTVICLKSTLQNNNLWNKRFIKSNIGINVYMIWWMKLRCSYYFKKVGSHIGCMHSLFILIGMHQQVMLQVSTRISAAL